MLIHTHSVGYDFSHLQSTLEENNFYLNIPKCNSNDTIHVGQWHSEVSCFFLSEAIKEKTKSKLRMNLLFIIYSILL